jgi:hypothetical protein
MCWLFGPTHESLACSVHAANEPNSKDAAQTGLAIRLDHFETSKMDLLSCETYIQTEIAQ